jgi:MoaA/NifB/PqqE/SkfB family radical SAM enzyme
MDNARNYIAELDIGLDWDLPVPYSPRNPVALEVEDEEDEFVEGAGRAWLYVEPDGDVLPAQGINKVLGNLLNQDWEEVWKDDL